MIHLKLILRNLFKLRIFTILNIIGLAVGFACSFAVIVWVKNEFSYDKHLPDSDRIYRLTFETINSGNRLHFARCWEKWIRQIPADFPQIEELVRLEPYRHTAIKAGDNKFYSDRIFATDRNFFNVFNIGLLSGNTEKVLSEPYSAIISSSLAGKCFGNSDPIGQNIWLSGEYDTKMVLFTIKGVMNDSPVNSHIHFDILTSFVQPEESPSWAYVYLLFKPNTAPEIILSQFYSFLRKVVQEKDQTTFVPYLQKITDIHLYSDKVRESEPNGNITATWLFIIVALIMLLVSWVNYYNLNKARLFTLRKQIQIQRITGSTTRLIIVQLLTESVICVLLALIFAIILLDLSDSPAKTFFSFSLMPGMLFISGFRILCTGSKCDYGYSHLRALSCSLLH